MTALQYAYIFFNSSGMSLLFDQASGIIIDLVIGRLLLVCNNISKAASKEAESEESESKIGLRSSTLSPKKSSVILVS